MRKSKQRVIFSLFILSICNGITMAADSPCGDWEPYKDEKCFKIIDETTRTYDDAEKTCSQQENSATLIIIHSKDEQDFLSNLLFKTHKVLDNVWIGVKYTSNKFKWIDDSDISFTNWAAGSPQNQTGNDCVQMIQDATSRGKWINEPCGRKNSVVCQKMQNWPISYIQKTLLEVKKKLDKTTNELYNIRNELNDTRHELERIFNQRLESIEGTFMRSFEVGGSINYYYPVAFRVHRSNFEKPGEVSDRSHPRTPLTYDIYRNSEEKAPKSLDTFDGHYMALTLKLMCTNGGWSAGANVFKVLLHQWLYNKGIAKIYLFDNHESRLFVWLRGGGVLYHIRSPIDLTQKITVYLEDNAIAAPAFPYKEKVYPAVTVSPIAVGSEDPNLVKTGTYDGWGF